MTWLANLGPDQLLALAIGFVLVGLLVPRWVLKREREISDQWRQAYLTEAETNDRQTEILQQVLAAVQAQPVGRHRADG